MAKQSEPPRKPPVKIGTVVHFAGMFIPRCEPAIVVHALDDGKLDLIVFGAYDNYTPKKFSSINQGTEPGQCHLIESCPYENN